MHSVQIEYVKDGRLHMLSAFGSTGTSYLVSGTDLA